MPFDLQPVLTGALVHLRPLRAGDFDALYAVASDPHIWEQHPESNRHELAVFRTFFDGAIVSGGALLETDAMTGAVIGSSRYFLYDETRRAIEIGWSFLARSHWGGRHNREMKRLMLQHAFRFVDRVHFIIGVRNLRSQRAIENIGAVRIGRRIGNQGHDSYVYELTASQPLPAEKEPHAR